jgi:Tol biopolymer transport system component
LAVTAVAGCHGDVEPFSADDRNPEAGDFTLRLTFNPGDDRTPTWSLAGDSVYYAAAGFDVFADESVVLVGLPRDGGAAGLITTNVQVPGTSERWLIAPQVSPSGEWLTYAEVGPPWPEVCPGLEIRCSPAQNDPSPPRLRDVILRVRRLDATGSVEDDPSLTIQPSGVDYDFDILNIPKYHVVHNYPFHQLFDDEGTAVFRPSWAPDSDKLAFSDGLGLRIWTIGDADAPAIPNTSEGVSPAWSPDGQWVAFTRLERADSSSASCEYWQDPPPIPPTPSCVQDITDYTQGPRRLSLIRPDGSDLRELGEGEDPAWTPDGSMLFFRRSNQIWKSASDGSNAAPLSFTENGHEPAISPDGRYLAFAVHSERGDHDIWVISLEDLP